MLAANRDIGLVSTNLDLFSIVDRFTRLGAQDHGRLAGTVLADGLNLLNLVCQQEEVFRPLKEFISKIIFKAKSHHRHIQFIHNSSQVINMVSFQKLSFID